MSLAIDDLFSVAGKTAVITGGSRGIGAMIARAYVANGARVILASRKADEVEAMAAELGEAATAVAVDLGTMAGIDRLAAAVAERTDRVDILVNNAGASWGASFASYPEAGWDKVMDLNVKSVFYLTQKLLPLLQRAASREEFARVINIGSIDGLHVNPIETYAYGASKAAVLHLTRMMARHLADRHIAVNAIAPGYFPSKMTAPVADAIDGAIVAQTPFRRWGDERDMAGVALFLASRASAYLCGSVIVVDGGYATTG